jgi:hypothetical protein
MTSVLLLPVGLPPILYPVAFWLTLLGLLISGDRDARAGVVSGSSPLPAPIR